MKTCGTYSGYTIHIQKRTPPCDACKKASREYQNARRKEINAKLGYDPRRFKRHGITKEIYDKLLSKYDGKCWICKDLDGTHIDHDHKCCDKAHSCGKCISGILCGNCNTAIGLLKDSVDNVKSALDYIVKYR